MTADHSSILPVLLLLSATPVEAVEAWEVAVISASAVAGVLFLLCIGSYLCASRSSAKSDDSPPPAAGDRGQGGGVLATAKQGVKSAAGKVGSAANTAAGMAGSAADRALDGMESAVGVAQDEAGQATAPVATGSVFSSTSAGHMSTSR